MKIGRYWRLGGAVVAEAFSNLQQYTAQQVPTTPTCRVAGIPIRSYGLDSAMCLSPVAASSCHSSGCWRNFEKLMLRTMS